jgi:hypothetical protein
MAIFGSDPEQKDRDRWTRLAEVVGNGLRNFQILGAALKEIRDQQLYRFEFATFELCCEAKWKITSRHALRLITAFETAKEIGPIGPDVAEHHLRPLAALPIDQRKAAYDEAQQDGGDVPAIERAVRRRKPKKKPTGLKPLRMKVPGGTIAVTPNRRATSHEQMLVDALHMLRQAQHADAA